MGVRASAPWKLKPIPPPQSVNPLPVVRMAPPAIAEAKSPVVGGVIAPVEEWSLKMNHPPPGWRFMTVVWVPSEMRTPVGFEGAGTSPTFLAGGPSAGVGVELACALLTTVAGGMRHPPTAVTTI